MIKQKCVLALSIVLTWMPVSLKAQIAYSKSEVTPSVWLFTPNDPGVGNAVAIITGNGIVMVDATHAPSAGQQVIDVLVKEANLPVTYLINTHWHDDHIWGNQTFKETYPNMQLVAHRFTYTNMKTQAIPSLEGTIQQIEKKVQERDLQLASGQENGEPIPEERKKLLEERQRLFKAVLSDYKSIKPTLPEMLFDKALTIYPSDKEVQVLHLGNGHSEGDAVVYLPQAKVAILGDLLTLPIPAGATVPLEEQITTLEKVLQLDAEVWIPGHGQPQTDPEHIRQHLTLLRSLQGLLPEIKNKKLGVKEAVEFVKGHDLGKVFTKGNPRLEFAFNRFFIQTTLEFLLSN